MPSFDITFNHILYYPSTSLYNYIDISYVAMISLCKVLSIKLPICTNIHAGIYMYVQVEET